MAASSSSGSDQIRPLPQANLMQPNCNVYGWLHSNGGPTAKQGDFEKPPSVVIVGAGVSGVYASLLLARAGANVTVLEANKKAGGRLQDAKMADGSLAQQGAMRFGEGQANWLISLRERNYFVKMFPNPGILSTAISYRGHTTIWNDQSKAPTGFETTFGGLTAFFTKGLCKNGKTVLTSWTTIQKMLANPMSSNEAQRRTQAWFTEFPKYSMAKLLRYVFRKNSKYDVPGGIEFSEDDFNKVGVLGVGSGPWGSLEDGSILWWMSVICNNHESKQGEIYKIGKDGRQDKSSGQKFLCDLAKTARKHGATYQYNKKVTGLTKDSSGKVTVTWIDLKTKARGSTRADILIPATTPKAMTKLSGLSQFLPESVHGALHNMYSINSSKLFLLCEKKYAPDINNLRFPKVIVGDHKSPQLYCQQAANPDHVLVLAVYAWNKVADDLDNSDAQEFYKISVEAVRRNLGGKTNGSKTELKKFETQWLKMLQHPVGEFALKKWNEDPYVQSAFPIVQPGQENNVQIVSNHLLSKSSVYPIGDYYNSSAGWVEGAMEAAVLTTSTILKNHGTLRNPKTAPCNLMKKGVYNFR